MKFNLNFIAQSTQAQVLSMPHGEFLSYSLDSRDPQLKGKIFIALIGENHDSHQFVEQAIQAGATGVVIHQWNESWESYKNQVSFLLVKDTLKALQDFSSAWRKTLKAQVIGITGSNGKTTTKDFLGQILSSVGSTHINQGSFNNHWGLPITLLDSETSHQFVVTEMGMNHAGEITTLNHIAQPDIVTVVNVGRAHIGNFSNGIEGIAQAKEEIYLSAPAQSRFVFNIDNSFTLKMMKRHQKPNSLTFSLKDKGADVFIELKKRKAQSLQVHGHVLKEKFETDLQFWGDQNIENLAAAAALASAAGVSNPAIIKSLSSCSTGWGRNQWLKLQSGATALFDAYNANPDSFEQLFKNLESSWSHDSKYRAVFGEMRELGEHSHSEHFRLGQRAAGFPWQQCLFIGPSSASFAEGFKSQKNQIKPIVLNTYEETLDLELDSMLNDKTLIIIKGSRGSAMERIVKRLHPLYFSDKK